MVELLCIISFTDGPMQNHVIMQSVTLGDEEARKRKVQKTILERKGPPTFTCAVEMISKTECQVHHKLEATVDTILAGILPLYYVFNKTLEIYFQYFGQGVGFTLSSFGSGKPPLFEVRKMDLKANNSKNSPEAFEEHKIEMLIACKDDQGMEPGPSTSDFCKTPGHPKKSSKTCGSRNSPTRVYTYKVNIGHLHF